MASESGVKKRPPTLSRAPDPLGRSICATHSHEAGSLGPAGTKGIACGCQPGSFAKITEVGSQFEMAKEKTDSSGEEQDVGDKYRIKHKLITQQKLRSVQGLVTKMAGWHHLMATSQGTTDTSSPAVGLPLDHGRGLEEGAGPSREGCRNQWDRLECLFLLSPPPAALSLKKPLKSSARL